MKQIRQVVRKMYTAYRKRWKFIIGGLLIGYICLLAWAFFSPRQIAYNFGAGQSCGISPQLFPSAQAKLQVPYTVRHVPTISIGSFHIYAHRVCAAAHNAPRQHQTYAYSERFVAKLPLHHRLSITTSAYPSLRQKQPLQPKVIAPETTLRFSLNTTDHTFTYVLANTSASAPCTMEANDVVCETAQLDLGYAQRHTLQLVRQYRGKSIADVAKVPLETITPTTIVETSIMPGSTIQDRPTELQLTTDKTLSGVGDIVLVAKNATDETVIPTASTIVNNKVIVKLGQELPRKTPFELRIASLEATDTSGLIGKTYSLAFATSGGPRVTSANIGTRNVSLMPTITVAFDQMLLSTQDAAKHITFTINGQAFPATYGLSGNKITVKPTASLPLCAHITIRVNASVQNNAGVSGDSSWSMSARTICYTTFSIGTSVRGRSITAYRFGSGPSLIVYMGAMHGSEANSKRIMDEWFRELSNYPERIPSHRSIVIIPSVNPDGIAAGTRTNTNNVDINRNFPANDWKSIVTMPGSSTPTAAGGSAPLSEPESRAVASFIQQQQPRLVLSFHSKAAIVEANEAGDSVSIAAHYASRASYRAVPKSQSTPIFQYDTTGAMEDWMRDRLGRPAIVVELSTSTSSEFTRNRSALWYTAGL